MPSTTSPRSSSSPLATSLHKPNPDVSKQSINKPLKAEDLADDSHPPAASPSSQHDPPPLKQSRSNFDLEPNPFEQSFARPSNDSALRTRQQSPSTCSLGPASNSSQENDRPPSSNSANKLNHCKSPRPLLPPLASISSPSDQSYSWNFASAGLTNSLRAGPLSPAMLAGPQDQNAPSQSFDPNSFRSGFTPRAGLTPGTGLTPLLGGPISFPPSSPNTTAFLNMMNNPQTPSSNLPNSAATITPNTLNAIAGVLSQSNNTNNSPHPLSVSHIPPQTTTSQSLAQQPQSPSHTQQQYYSQQHHASNGYANSASAAANSAANGLFLLSQAHQELTKREAEARAGSATVGGSPPALSPSIGKRGIKRKSNTESAAPSPANNAPKGRRLRTDHGTSTRSKRVTVSPDGFGEEEEEEDDEDDDDAPAMKRTSTGKGGSGGRGNKAPMTEEEKRKNFLERNRQAALKCRQRKKAWLAQLQVKVEYLENENERLTTSLVASREEISRLSAIVGASGVASTVSIAAVQGGAGSGVTQAGGIQSGPAKTIAAPTSAGGGGRGYGY